jgi:hypothetical protein
MEPSTVKTYTEPDQDNVGLDKILDDLYKIYPNRLDRSVVLLERERLRHYLYMAWWSGFNRGEFITKRNLLKNE